MQDITIQLKPDSRPIPLILARHVAITGVFCAIVAVVITYTMRLGGSFIENLMFSMCIGTLAWGLIDGGRLLIWGRGMPPWLPFILLVVIAMPVAKFLGSVIATQALGLNPQNVIAHQAKNATGIIIITVLACAIITWFFWSKGHMAVLKASFEAEKARAAAIEKQALQAQLQMLQAQIEPHMLFNTLANLQALIAVDAPRAQRMLDQLIQYLRATLSSSRSRQTSLEHEFSLLEAYLGLMQVRMGVRLSYALQLPQELRKTMIPPMLLQPLVENAIRHALEPKIDGGHIDVRATQETGMLKLSVIDTGLGLDGPTRQPGTRLGIANLRERLRALYGEQASFSLTPNIPCGVAAHITIPL